MSINPSVLRARIENAAEVVGPLWPLQTFNAANPLSGFENLPFDRAVQQARRLFGGRGYPQPSTFRQGWENGEIDPAILTERLAEHDVNETPEALLERMEADENGHEGAVEAGEPDVNPLDRGLTKWLAAYCDQGQASWPMPGRGKRFYEAWRALAPYDSTVPGVERPADLPDTLLEAFENVLGPYPENRWETIFIHHLTALPGWVGYIRWRSQADDHPWQDAHPINLADYLAVRLTMAERMGATIAPDRSEALPDVSDEDEKPSLASIWLEAWEESYRRRLLADVDRAASTAPSAGEAGGGEADRPVAQWVFCIDVRSEILRRHLEAAGPHETYGYAGFFGIPMQHERYGDGTRVKACPPILDPRHRIADRPAPDREDAAEQYEAWTDLTGSFQKLVKTLKDNVAAAFGFVEGSGGFFGAAMAARTLMPGMFGKNDPPGGGRVPSPDDFCEPVVDRPKNAEEDEGGLPLGLSREAKIVYAEAAFRLMGWTETFAPVVVFTGHGSQTPNNPYKSSLDCGACAANPGGPNARVLAAICNQEPIRDALRERGIDIPDDTVFLAGEHNTTTDAVRLYVDEDDPPIDRDTLDRLRADLKTAQQGASADRIQTMNDGRPASSVRDTERRAGDWAETRPEWGLAGNAAFIVGPRRLTQPLDLDGRCFLHSYDWQADEDGTALENIMTGPLVVGEWINMQYYFSTVDNAAYGSGSKVTHNVVGNLGILQGNGGDLMSGLPLQSLQSDDRRVYHRPLRLMGLIHAPLDRVKRILNQQDTVRQLVDHRWVALTVMDPERDDAFLRYRPGGEWGAHPRQPAAEPAVA